MLWQLDLSEAKRQLQGDGLFPLHSGVRKSPCKQRAVEATQVVCNSFVTLALFQYSAFKNITTQNQWFRLCVDTNIVT